jgi:SAM-dependent methyltransferase
VNRWAKSYPSDYSADVRRALFGLPHDLFLRGKANWLNSWLARRSRDAGKVLDIGCGTGLLHPYLPGKITGVDVSETALKMAAARNQNADYRLYDGRVLPFPDATFDTALAVTVLHHIPPANWHSFIAEIARVLRSGGVLIVNEHNPWNPLTRLSVAISALDHDAVLLTARRAVSLMHHAGLRMVGRDYLHFTPIDSALSCLPSGAQYCAYGFKE